MTDELTEKARKILTDLPADALRRYVELGEGNPFVEAIASALREADKEATERAVAAAEHVLANLRDHALSRIVEDNTHLDTRQKARLEVAENLLISIASAIRNRGEA